MNQAVRIFCKSSLEGAGLGCEGDCALDHVMPHTACLRAGACHCNFHWICHAVSCVTGGWRSFIEHRTKNPSAGLHRAAVVSTLFASVICILHRVGEPPRS